MSSIGKQNVCVHTLFIPLTFLNQMQPDICPLCSLTQGNGKGLPLNRPEFYTHAFQCAVVSIRDAPSTTKTSL